MWRNESGRRGHERCHVLLWLAGVGCCVLVGCQSPETTMNDAIDQYAEVMRDSDGAVSGDSAAAKAGTERWKTLPPSSAPSRSRRLARGKRQAGAPTTTVTGLVNRSKTAIRPC